MNFSYFMIFCTLWLAPPSVSARNTSCNDGVLLISLTRKSLHQEFQQQRQQEQIDHNTSTVNQSDGITDPKLWRNRHAPRSHRHLRTVHGTVNIMGWGVLLPFGVITARYLRKQSNDWYSLHIVSQVSGFLLGTLGWGLGISIKNAAKEHSMSTHGIIGTIIFAFAFIQPDEDRTWRRYWVIYHHVAGYALIALIIANIFQGINKQNAAKKWEWIYGTVLGVLGVSTFALEVLRWIGN